MTTNNSINLGSQGIPYYNGSGTFSAISLASQGMIYYNGTNAFSGVDGGTSGHLLTSNGTGVAPSFQAIPATVSVGSFFAYNSATLSNVSGDGTVYDPIIFNTISYDTTGGGYNSTTGIYTAPINGTYFFYSLLRVGAGASATQWASGMNTTAAAPTPAGTFSVQGSSFPTRNQVTNFYGPNAEISLYTSFVINLAAGEQVTCGFQATGGTKTSTVNANSFFCGFLVAAL